MSAENPNTLSHVSIGTNDFTRSVNFYEKALATLGCKRILDYPEAVAFGKLLPEFWV
jgi:catechol 2,3-dioxygenase-like lactoylglutathione lyase family enzyme